MKKITIWFAFAVLIFGAVLSFSLPIGSIQSAATRPIYVTNYVYYYPKATNWVNVTNNYNLTNNFIAPIDLMTVSNLYISKVVTN